MSQGGIINEYPQNMLLRRGKNAKDLDISPIDSHYFTSVHHIIDTRRSNVHIVSYIALTHYCLISPPPPHTLAYINDCIINFTSFRSIWHTPLHFLLSV